MSWHLSPFQGSNLFLCLVLLLQTGEALVNTEIQTGPLYRVVDAPLSISCNVSGFFNADIQKHFEFRITKPAKPTFALNIISTSDKDFAYSQYSQRVSNEEITLKHVTPNSVLFEIKRLQKDDEGEYACFVNNNEELYAGTYEAMSTVKVIDNSLSVSSPVSSSLSYTEGDALTVTCQASSNTIQHTHLSLAWYLHKDAEENAQPIISLNRDFTLSPGQGFEGRYRAGTIRLDKIGEATYRLTMAQLELSDQGRLYCQAQEWIQDPDGSWFVITQKEAAEITVDVKAREVIRDTSSLVVRISAQQTTLQEGQELLLSCQVDTHELDKKFLTVAWLRDGVELANIGPTGVLSVGPEYSGREKERELRAARIEDRHYRLILQPVRTEDKGKYTCQAWPEERGPDGVFIKGNVQNSQISLLVSVSATESSLSVEMQPTVNVREGDRLTLSCKVKGVKGPLSVTWQYQPTSTAAAVFRNIVSVNQEGVAETGSEYMTPKVSARRPAADTFVLELDKVKPTESGVYHCAVSEWKTNSKALSQSQSSTVLVAPVETFVKVHLINRKTKVTVGERVELLCRVRGPNVPVTLTWSLQRDGGSLDNILTIYSDGAISWSEDNQGYQLRVENKVNEVAYYLLINSASHREAGTYQCKVSAFLDEVYKKLPPSNPVAVVLQNPVSKLVLTSPGKMTEDINGQIEMKCSVESESSASSRYAVTWLHQHQGENHTIVSSDRDALMTFGTHVKLNSSRHRISMRRTKGPSFELTIRQAQISDNGLYICEVVEWLQDPRGNWYQLPPVSQTTELQVSEPANDLQVQIKEQQLTVTEGEEVELQCDIVSGSFTPSFFYKIAWHFSKDSHPSMIVELDHTGLLRYAENNAMDDLRGRLGLHRPTQSSFSLTIQRAHEEDSGSYWCQVDQYQMDHKSQWQQKATDTAGPIRVAVNVTETNLSLLINNEEKNVTRSENFTIPCHIERQSGSESKFKVTWFWQRETGSQKQPIFTAYRNATIQNMIGDELRFGHPLPNQYSLTVTRPGPEKNGLYFCEVEEWLPSLSHGWRKAAVGTSGHLTVNVWAEGEPVPQPLCQSGTWIGIFVVFVICSLLVILILMIKIFRTKTSGREPSGQSLWAEEHPLKTKPRAYD